jgi:MinD-like ATPase involved in chromosome partitioning or flagellar assembly
MPSAGESHPHLNGRIVTFYSFKGGTGRTMALANAAWILAANGKRVLIADWDLESPGLHRFFEPFMEAGMSDRPGIIDFIRKYSWAAVEAENSPDAFHTGSSEPEASNAARDTITAMIDKHISEVRNYTIPLTEKFPEPGALHFLSPGKQTNGDYEQSLVQMDWDNFYDNLYGALFLDALRALLKREYDYVLIDSRTGFSDVADICTVHLPDIVVDCFTLSTQGIHGAALVADSIQEHNHRDIAIFPVPMRIDRTQNEKVEEGLAFAADKFGELPTGMSEAERREYWSEVEVPYQPSYACEETLAVFGDAPGSPVSLLSAYERIVARITEGTVTTFPPRAEWLRLRTRLLFSRAASPLGHVVLDFKPEDQLWFEWIAAVLGSAGITVRLTSEAPVGPGDAGVTTENVAIVSNSYLARIHDADLAVSPDVLVSVTDTPLPPQLVEAEGSRIIELASLSEAQAVDSLIEGFGGQRPADLGSDIGALRYPGSDRPQVQNLPARNTNFTGRDETLWELHEKLRSRPETPARPVIIRGLSGLGKTQVALEYAHRFGPDYDVIWWMNCGLSQYVDASLVDLAQEMRTVFHAALPEEGGGPETVRQLLRYLSEGRADKRWLLIYDNADDVATIKSLLPFSGGHVLITVRDERWANEGTSVEVGKFDRMESISHLRQRKPGIAEAEANGVADVLGDIPLAVAAAGALMASTGMSASEYLEQLSQQSMPSLPEGHMLGAYPKPAVQGWCLSLDQLKKRSVAAARLLDICSMMAPDISLSLIYSQAMVDALRELDPAVSERNMIEGLIRRIDLLALIKLDNNARQVQVHAVVQAVVTVRMDEEEKATARRGIHQLLVAARPQGDMDDPQMWPRYRLIWPHLRPSGAISSVDEPVRQLLIERVQYLRYRGDLDRGRRRAVETQTVWKSELGKEPELPGLRPQLLRLQFSLANILRDQAQFGESRALDEAVLDEQRQLLGEEHPHTLFTRGSLAADLRALGDYGSALNLDLETYRLWSIGYGDETPGTLTAANNLALSYLLTGDFRDALHQDRLTLGRRRSVLGPTHPRTLGSGIAIARDLLEAGRYAEAVTQMAQVSAQCREALGDDDRSTLRARLWYGVALRCAGHAEQASGHIEAARTGLIRGWGGEDSSDALACRLSQALNLLAMNQPEEGRIAAEGVLAIYTRRVGNEHPHSLICTLNISTAQCLEREYAAAETAARAAVGGLRERLGHAHPYTLAANMVLASTYAFQKNLAEAQGLEQEVTAERERVLGTHHPDTWRSRANLLLTQHELGDERASNGRHEIAVRLAEILGPGHPDVGTVESGGRLLCTIDPQPF